MSTTVMVDGETIGIVGATTPSVRSITSPGSNWTNDALAAEIQPAVDALTEDGVNKIILLSHMQQLDIERDLATLLSGVDIIVAGGSNTVLADTDDTLRAGDTAADTYPLALTSASGEPVLIVNVYGDYQYLGRLVAPFNDDGIVLTDNLVPEVNGPVASTESVVTALGATANSEVVAIRDALNTAIGRLLQPVGYTDVFLDGRRFQVRSEETNMGNLTADANAWYAQQVYTDEVDISLKNGGGIRAEIPQGVGEDYDFPGGTEEVTLFDVQTTLRFNNGLTLLTVTPAELKVILESTVAGFVPNDTDPGGAFPQIGGMRFSFDPEGTAQVIENFGEPNETVITAGTRIRDVVIVDDSGNAVETVVENGEVVETSSSYRMVTLAFLANGGGGGLVNLSNPNRVDLAEESGLTDPGNVDADNTGGERDALAEYFQAFHSTETDAYDVSEGAPENDLRVQNLGVRSWEAPPAN